MLASRAGPVSIRSATRVENMTGGTGSLEGSGRKNRESWSGQDAIRAKRKAGMSGMLDSGSGLGWRDGNRWNWWYGKNR
jgi:hypothetical protein